MDMQIATVTCKTCGTILQVKNSRNESVKSIECPRCHSKITIRFQPSQQAGAADPNATALGPAVPAGDTTNLGQYRGGDSTRVPERSVAKMPYLVCNGREYPLSIGHQIVGRRSNMVQVDVPLDVNDQFMSRQHVTIDVQMQGGMPKALIKNFKNTNSTFVAGMPLNNGEEVYLNHGMTIRLGDTTITYRLK